MANIACKVSIKCFVNVSEDVQKVQYALLNLFPDLQFIYKNSLLQSNSDDLQCLEKIVEQITNKQLQRSFARQIQKNTRIDSSLWFYLNKQAAFAGVVALCEHADESPLGPIKISIESRSIDDVTKWLIG